MACQSQSAHAKLAINGTQMEFLEFDGGQTIELVDSSDQANRGFFDHAMERVTQGLKIIRFKITMQPSPSELDILIPLMGFAQSPTDTFTPTDNFDALDFSVIADRVAKVHTYAGCIVDKAIFKGAKGRTPITLELHIVGKTETEGNAGTFSASALDTDHNYAFTEGVLTLEGSARPFSQFALGIENNVFASFNNSQTAECIHPTDRNVWLACSSPYNTTHADLYTKAAHSGAIATDVDGAAGSLVFTRSTKSTTFTFANLKSIAKSPNIPSRSEIRLDQFYKAYRSGSTASVIITHDNTA
jgi:hypothetical protein